MMQVKGLKTFFKHGGAKWLKRGLLIVMVLALQLSGCSESASAPYSKALYISEVVSSNSDSLTDPEYGSPDWIELHNPSDEAVNLADYTISESNGNKYTFPAVVIDAQSYLVIYCCNTLAIPADADAAVNASSEITGETAASPEATVSAETVFEGPVCTNFKLSRDGTALTLSSPQGKIQELTVPALDTDISFGYREDGTYGYFLQSTPGQPNTAPSYATMEELRSGQKVALTISEVLPKGASGNWVELYNAGDTAIQLSDYYITENLSNLKKASLPAMTLEAGQYALVKFGGQSGGDSVPFKLGSDETTLAISDHLGLVIDRLSWDANILPGISAGHGEGDGTVYYAIPTPGAANGADFIAITDLSLTEGRDEVYMNELLLSNEFSIIDQYGERSPWVELYNSSGQPVSLSRYALSDDLESLWKWNLPDITLEADSYMIIYLTGKDIREGELHTSFRLGSADTALYLTNLTSQTMQTLTLPTDNKDNVSYGLSSGTDWLFYPQPTPMAANTTQGFTEIAAVGAESAGLRINEVASVSNPRDGKRDWVELYNGASSEISLSGYHLTDSKSDTTKWSLGSASIKSGGYKTIDEYQHEGGSGELTIALSGETLYLFSPEGLLVDQLNTGVLRPGISRGVYSGDGSENSVVFFDNPTPGKENGGDILVGYCAAPLFSVPGGYQSGAVTLELSTSTAGGVIYYTTNGATPTENSTQYTGPIKISSTKAIRAITIADGMITSDETVATYLLGIEHSLPVVCLSITGSDLSYVFGSADRDDIRERGGYVEYYEADGTLGVSFPAGFRIAGAGTRVARQKSINLYLRGGYGRSSVTYPFFEGYDITTFKSLSLRNMGAWQDETRMKDVFVSMAVNGMNVDNAQSKFAVLYINGEYRGLYEFKENQNEEYFVSRYGIDPDKVVMVRGNKYNVQTGRSDRDIVNLYALAQRDMNNEELFEAYTSLADSDYFMDYLIAETFFNCYDTYNQKYAHTTDNSLLWRPIFYDFDICLGSVSAVVFGTFDRGIYVRKATDSQGRSHETYMYLYHGFLNNDEWERQFIIRYAEVLNTILTTDRLLALYDGLVDSIKDEIPRTSEKWGYPSSARQWQKDAASMRSYLENRRKYVIRNLQNYFHLSDAYMVELFPNG
jgi:hypothetical protein